MSSSRVAAIHQPNFVPWIGYFHKILKSDVFIFLDHVEYTRRSFINRNRIKGPTGAKWLTVPVSFKNKPSILVVQINNNLDWKRNHLSTFKAFYGKAEHFEEIYSILEEIYEKKWVYLAEFNKALIKEISSLLDLHTEFVDSHTLHPREKKMGLIIELCTKVNANIYFSGKGAIKYQDPKVFEEHGIKLVYQEFEHPVYPQRFGEFISNLSILDMLFNVGIDESKKILKGI